jgi:hypothetical protein
MLENLLSNIIQLFFSTKPDNILFMILQKGYTNILSTNPDNILFMILQKNSFQKMLENLLSNIIQLFFSTKPDNILSMIFQKGYTNILSTKPDNILSMIFQKGYTNILSTKPDNILSMIFQKGYTNILSTKPDNILSMILQKYSFQKMLENLLSNIIQISFNDSCINFFYGLRPSSSPQFASYNEYIILERENNYINIFL